MMKMKRVWSLFFGFVALLAVILAANPTGAGAVSTQAERLPTSQRDVDRANLDEDSDLDAFVINTGNQANEIWLNDDRVLFQNSSQNLSSPVAVYVGLGDENANGDPNGFQTNSSVSDLAWWNGYTCNSNCLRSVAILDFSGSYQSNFYVVGLVVARDENNQPVPDAAVSAIWTRPDGSSQEQLVLTNGNGIGRLIMLGGSGVYHISIVAMQKSGYSFDPENSILETEIAASSGITSRVSVASDGSQGNGSSYLPSLSADGRFVAFLSYANNLVAGDTNGQADIFVHDHLSGETERVSLTSGGSQGNGNSFTPSLSADGRFVAYESYASNLVTGDTNGRVDIFVYDRLSTETERVSVASDGSQGNDNSYNPSVSADGRFVAFYSYARNLLGGDINNAADIFVYDRLIGQTFRVSVSSSGNEGNSWSCAPFISGDGQYIVFISNATNLVSGDTNSKVDVFVHHRLTGQTVRVSVSSNGSQGNGHSGYDYCRHWPVITFDGRYAVFRSNASNLVIGDTNEAGDIFVHDLASGQTSRVSLASNGSQAAQSSDYLAISGDGHSVAFASRAGNLVVGDSNGCLDVFVHDRELVGYEGMVYVPEG